MEKDMLSGGSGFPERLKRRTMLKLGAGLITTFTLGGTEVWRLAHSPQTAHAAAAATPSIISCATWGARPPDVPVKVLNISAKEILIHHTVFPNTTNYTLAQAYKLARQIQNFHMDSNDWIDTGQQFTVSRGGYILEGRHKSLAALQSGKQVVEGTHCPAMNQESIGIENEGTYTAATPPETQLAALVDLCAYICVQYGLQANSIFGHMDFHSTECPGRRFYALLPALRRRVAQRLGSGASMAERNWPELRLKTSGIGVQVVQRLLNNKGYAVGVSGTFESATDAAIRRFQSSNQLPVNGHVTNQTWEKLVTSLHTGSAGAPVSALQSLLNRNGYGVGITGTFSAATASAVRQLQLLHQLPASGSVDINTWCAATGGSVRSSLL
ncbi:hypothetical protein KDA_38310 [Dictyobacter alpinus]|uniref:N-acetylmuramoyl-L-alanine amidase n=1 Tax=Dictyobacter alpinus TaxID=2014873 RepID=A0A402BAM9_9CHLR|nr:N-acetylmuramoyl-L-alanine amidase [Dictyobacter alpinus]GCE28347.1 hypothetical protein KDA_38310 [Dictyobacter alpinus]